MKIINKRFDSTTVLTTWLNNTDRTKAFKKANKESSRTGSAYFTKTANYDEADALMLNGWHEGAARVRSYIGESRIKSTFLQTYNDVTGFVCNVGAYVQGSPMCMMRRRPVPTVTKTVKITYNISVDVSVSSDDIEKAGARLFNVISGLQMQGVGVELWVVMVSTRNDVQLNAAVKIKNAGDPFNILQICYPMIHPSFFRRHMFALIERSVNRESWVHGYGYVVEDARTIKESLTGMNVPTDNILSFYTLENKSEREIFNMIK